MKMLVLNSPMPRLSLYNPQKSNNYRYIDNVVKEQFTVGGTDLLVHKYIGPAITKSTDKTQPIFDKLDPTNIGDLLFLENRNRKYDQDVYVIRGHYNVQNLDFDMSQFGLFLTNDVIFITIHYNTMIDLFGRKLMVGDVLELPHLTDYHPLNETLPIGLRKYYQVTDGNYASEGFSVTWYPHMWRIKCEPLTDVQEFANILDKPVNTDNYMGEWKSTTTYPAGYTVTSGGITYITKQDTPAGTLLTNTTYWEVDNSGSIRDLISTYNKNIAINDALIEEAVVQVPKAGYDRSQLYLVPEPHAGTPFYENPTTVSGFSGTIDTITSVGYSKPSKVIRISATALNQFQQMMLEPLSKLSLELCEVPPEVIGNSGQISGNLVLLSTNLGTASGSIVPADPNVDPKFAYLVKSANAESYGDLTGYLVQTEQAPNGIVAETGTSFPQMPQRGDYFLRTDYRPSRLFMFDGNKWVAKSSEIRTATGMTSDDLSLKSTFVNNTNTVTTQQGTMPEKQALSSIFRIKPD